MTKPKILLVNGDEDSSAALAVSLADAGYEVVLEGDSVSAADFLWRNRGSVDGVVLEVSCLCGCGDGDRMVLGIRAAAPTVPVIVLSGDGCRKEQEEAWRYGVFGCLRRSADPIDVVKMMRWALRDSCACTVGRDACLRCQEDLTV